LFVDFTGLTGRRAAELRRQLKTSCGKGAKIAVVKTTLAKKALSQFGNADDGALAELFTGPTAIAYGADDPVILAKTLVEWGKKEQKQLRLKGGLLDGRPLRATAVAALAKIPPKHVLIAQVIGTIAAPLTGLLGVAQGPIRQLLGLAEALAKKKQAESGSAAA